MYTQYRRARRMAAATERVLVHFQDNNGSSSIAKFTQSILDALGLTSGDDLPVYAELKNNNLLLGNKSWADHLNPVMMRRPSFCPLHNLSVIQADQLPADIQMRGIDVGVAVILETGDNKVLLTRRARHLRTFPNVWVPPGGHVEQGETLHEAGLRELREETGLILSADHCVNKTIPILALWESAFPPMLSLGLPKRHHTVVYLYAKLRHTHTSQSLQPYLKPDPAEVGACAWVESGVLERLIGVWGEEGDQTEKETLSGLLPTFRAQVVSPEGSTIDEDLSTSILHQRAPAQGSDVERLSTGTKFALEQWIQYKQKQQT